ncbi:MAG: Aldose 1-epimerase [Actinomycetota bacterium]|nr:Aldose 1-epimerase [Actinomycetota bacterium]
MSAPLKYSVSTAPVPGSGGLGAVTLTCATTGLAASFVPEAGMVGCSLTLDGVQLLGMRQGMQAYLDAAKTFGIPLLAPWANRLAGDVYRAAGQDVTVKGVHGVHRDANGLALHGLLSGARGWQVLSSAASDDGAMLQALLHFDHDRDEYDAFPFPHDIGLTVALRGEELSITTTITPTGTVQVPIAFGWHPYFVIPGVPRSDWEVDLPLTRRIVLDARNIPTGEVQDWAWGVAPLGDSIIDDLFAEVPAGTVVSVAGGGVRVSLEYGHNYPYAVIFAPAEDDVVAIEPMTAPTDPFSGHFPLATVAPGDSYSATYAIRVERV